MVIAALTSRVAFPPFCASAPLSTQEAPQLLGTSYMFETHWVSPGTLRCHCQRNITAFTLHTQLSMLIEFEIDKLNSPVFINDVVLETTIFCSWLCHWLDGTLFWSCLGLDTLWSRSYLGHRYSPPSPNRFNVGYIIVRHCSRHHMIHRFYLF